MISIQGPREALADPVTVPTYRSILTTSQSSAMTRTAIAEESAIVTSTNSGHPMALARSPPRRSSARLSWRRRPAVLVVAMWMLILAGVSTGEAASGIEPQR